MMDLVIKLKEKVKILSFIIRVKKKKEKKLKFLIESGSSKVKLELTWKMQNYRLIILKILKLIIYTQMKEKVIL
jgi:hypothetical protein